MLDVFGTPEHSTGRHNGDSPQNRSLLIGILTAIERYCGEYAPIALAISVR